MKIYILEEGKTDGDYPPDDEGRMVLYLRPDGEGRVTLMSLDDSDNLDDKGGWCLLDISKRGFRRVKCVGKRSGYPIDENGRIKIVR